LNSIKRIRILKGVGVLADQQPSQASPEFLRYNLIYGFNGSGKSTLSRLFSCLQSNKVTADLPSGCSFGFELSDGSVRNSPDQLNGLEQRVCVFNADFIERNLRWDQGTANSIFYISEEQAEAAAALRAAEAELPTATAALTAAEGIVKERFQTLATFKRGLAKSIAGKLNLGNRRYEAPQLQSDFEAFTFEASLIQTKEALDEYASVVSRTSPPPTVTPIAMPIDETAEIVALAIQHAAATSGEAMLADLASNATMVPWARTGYEYHTDHNLASCLLCGNSLTAERRAILARAFDDSLARFVEALNTAQESTNAMATRVESAIQAAHQVTLMPELQSKLESVIKAFAETTRELLALLSKIDKLYKTRKAAPTSPVSIDLPGSTRVHEICENAIAGLELVNAVLREHNDGVANFGKHQQAARDAIKNHFLAENHAEYEACMSAIDDGEIKKNEASVERSKVLEQISALQLTVRTHGPAAATICKLVKAYLGHGELTIAPLDEGYELHRHGKLVKGSPSEGEKTALALCYFLSTLGADGRKLKDLIVVIDDPVSSLDTRAMNYACALIRTQLGSAQQLFVLTHNQHCMNEFKKDWKQFHSPKNPQTTPPNAAFIYLDVRVPSATGVRTTTLVEMPSLLKEYDSEYHFLCSKVLAFEAAGAAHSEYGFLMPNIIRRVLELFLAFKVPGTAPIKSKLATMTKLHSALDGTRMVALERLSQVESHSDSIDDFISHSSMTIEEARDANAALLELMKIADEEHTKLIRKQCQ